MCFLFLSDTTTRVLPYISVQDALAEAVAKEMQKVYQDELGPQPVPLTVPGEVIDDEDVSVCCCFHPLLPKCGCNCIKVIQYHASRSKHLKQNSYKIQLIFQRLFLDVDIGSDDDDKDMENSSENEDTASKKR